MASPSEKEMSNCPTRLPVRGNVNKQVQRRRGRRVSHENIHATRRPTSAGGRTETRRQTCRAPNRHLSRNPRYAGTRSKAAACYCEGAPSPSRFPAAGGAGRLVPRQSHPRPVPIVAHDKASLLQGASMFNKNRLSSPKAVTRTTQTINLTGPPNHATTFFPTPKKRTE